MFDLHLKWMETKIILLLINNHICPWFTWHKTKHNPKISILRNPTYGLKQRQSISWISQDADLRIMFCFIFFQIVGWYWYLLDSWLKTRLPHFLLFFFSLFPFLSHFLWLSVCLSLSISSFLLSLTLSRSLYLSLMDNFIFMFIITS